MVIIRQLWARLTLNQRLLAATLGGAFTLALVLSVLWARNPDYAVLYADVNPADAAGIVDQLRAKKIPYRLDEGGRTILVPGKQVYESRLDLAVQGLPASGIVGYEIFDKSGLGVTDFVQRLNFRRALEGEIARSIQSLNEVQHARVHIVIPDETFFAEDKKEATASVVLGLRGSLTDRQITGITRLVAAGVEGLRPDNVTVVDTSGNLLSRNPAPDDLAAASSSQLELKSNVERYLRQKIVGMLEGVLGQGKIVAQVDADLDFEQIERTVESYDPESQVVRSEQRTKDAEQEGGKSESTTTNYEISKTLERIVSPVGGVHKLTIAVLIDGTYAEGADGQSTYQPRSADEMTQLTGIIRTAVGFDETRGDRLEVHNVAFDNEAEVAEEKAAERSNRMALFMQILNRLGQVIVILLLAVLVRTLFMRTGRVIRTHSESVAGRAAAGEHAVAIPSEDEKYLRMQQDITQLAQQRPDEISQLIRTWLKED